MFALPLIFIPGKTHLLISLMWIRSIHEEFANLVSDCGLHWELCATLQRYLKRHLADNSSLPLNILQLGCELLLSVYTKKELLWNHLRDHLYAISR